LTLSAIGLVAEDRGEGTTKGRGTVSEGRKESEWTSA